MFKEFRNNLKKKQIGKSINMLQSDRGGEYFTKNFKIM
jgi:hypothetical protein